MSTRKTVYVTPVREGWKVKTDGAKRAAKITETQAEAIQIGRQIASNRRCELVVHRTDGTIRSKDSFGAEQFPPLNIYIPETGIPVSGIEA